MGKKVLTVIMDGVGCQPNLFGNAVGMAQTPHLNQLREIGLYCQLKAHGTAVGLPSDDDMGNSEVGHNTLGAGRVFDQGAKLVNNAFKTGSLFASPVWRDLIRNVIDKKSRLHFLGLLSDGNVHSHQSHLFQMMAQAKKEGVRSVRIHTLLDGRDVAEKSAEQYVAELLKVISNLVDSNFDVQVASGGGRMEITMDRYEADWEMVEKGWKAHVKGLAEHYFENIDEALRYFRSFPDITDQHIPAFVIKNPAGPVGQIKDGDSVIFFNFRGDRAIEISKAFTEKNFAHFDRGPLMDILFAGMMEYDGDQKVPNRFLVQPPEIQGTLGEYLASKGVRQYACSETQKYGHVTYFWNGNRTGKFSGELEDYHEILSDRAGFNLKPWMKASEITDQTIQRIEADRFDCGRINFANGDMVGHTGDFEAAIVAVATVDIMIGRLIGVCKRHGVCLIVTADHGNCEEMFQLKDFAGDRSGVPPLGSRPAPKTSHTLNPVPFYLYDPVARDQWILAGIEQAGIGHYAATVLALMGQEVPKHFLPSLIRRR